MSRTYTPELRAFAVLQWKTGESLDALATNLAVPKSTLQGWLAGETRTPVVPKNRRQIDEMAYDLIEAQFDAAIAISRKAADPAWLERQDANGLHLMHGVNHDKLLRLLSVVAGRPPAQSAIGAPDSAAGDALEVPATPADGP